MIRSCARGSSILAARLQSTEEAVLMAESYIMSIDQGTTGSTVLLVDARGAVRSRGYQEIAQHYPRAGWVEHDPQEIWAVTVGLAKRVLLQSNIASHQIAAIGITNQRETTVVWDAVTGVPLYNAIVWQCRRTAEFCLQMKSEGWSERVRAKTGLVIDAYFSGTKLHWILENVPGARERAISGQLRFGTIDSWLVWKLTAGRVHATDYSNASRTMLYDINKLCWDRELLEYMRVPEQMLPEVHDSSFVYGYTDPELLGSPIPVAGIAGDQQAALFGQGCHHPGSVKNTYGTGCFMLMHTGEKPVESSHGLLTTIAWGIDGVVTYAMEGSVFVAGAAVQWLRDELKIIKDAGETEELARSISDNGGVYMVPAFTGIGAPYWDMYARGTVLGLTRGAGRAQLARAVLEAAAYQTLDVLDAMIADSGLPIPAIRVDGGASANNFLMQFQADILNTRVERPHNTDSTALGAAFLAGLAVGYWQNMKQVESLQSLDRVFIPEMTGEQRDKLLGGWRQAVQCALAFK